uniref:Uncharacterized protein n=1 Tax=Rhipicephalus zambeziensis TaxID=60191 RepID=A0A224Y9B8_9ACAR
MRGASQHTGVCTCVVEPHVAVVVCTMPHDPRHPAFHFIRQYRRTITCLYRERFHFFASGTTANMLNYTENAADSQKLKTFTKRNYSNFKETSKYMLAHGRDQLRFRPER